MQGRRKELMVKVKVLMNYYDKQLGFYKNKDEEFGVSEERANQLVAAGVVEIAKEKEAVIPNETNGKTNRKAAKKAAK